MRKTLTFAALLICTLSFSQSKFVNIGMGYSYTNLSLGEASPGGFLIDFDWSWFHFDFASNYAQGEGEYLEYESSKTFQANKQQWLAYNFGANIKIANKLYITPKMGIVSLNDIWEDPVGTATHYKVSAGSNFQAGAELKYIARTFYIKAGSSTTEVFSMGLGFSFEI